MTRPVPDLCPHCGQPLPSGNDRLTARELDVLTAWWMEGGVKKAAARLGIGEQRAKNLLARARIRNRARTNEDLLARHFDAVLSAVRDQVVTKHDGAEAA